MLGTAANNSLNFILKTPHLDVWNMTGATQCLSRYLQVFAVRGANPMGFAVRGANPMGLE